MRLARLIPLCLIAITAMFTSHAMGQAATAKVAIANPSRIFSDMAETKALRAKLEARRKDLLGKEMQLRQAIEDLAQKRTQFKPGSAPYRDISEQLDSAKANLQVWGMSTKASVERDQKEMLKSLYDKIEATVAEVAQQNGIDLVIADGRQDIADLDEVPADDFRRLLNSRNILYSAKNVDISDKVLTLLDARYAQQGGSTGSTPPPIEAPASK